MLANYTIISLIFTEVYLKNLKTNSFEINLLCYDNSDRGGSGGLAGGLLQVTIHFHSYYLAKL